MRSPSLLPGAAAPARSRPRRGVTRWCGPPSSASPSTGPTARDPRESVVITRCGAPPGRTSTALAPLYPGYWHLLENVAFAQAQLGIEYITDVAHPGHVAIARHWRAGEHWRVRAGWLAFDGGRQPPVM